MANINQISVGAANSVDRRSIDLPAEELKIIGYFARGQKHLISNHNLKLEHTETSIRLSDNQGKLIGISKQVNEWQRKVLITNNSPYRAKTIEILAQSGFITKQQSSHPDFTEHHHYSIPDGYKLNYTEVIELWKLWWHNKRYQLNVPSPPIDVLIFSKGNWCLLRDLQPKQDTFVLRTPKKEITIDSDEYIVWLDSLSDPSTHSSSPPKQQIPSAHPSVKPDPNWQSSDNISTPAPLSPVQPMPQLAVPIDRRPLENMRGNNLPQRADLPESPAVAEEIDLETYLNTFNTEDSEDIDRIEGIYHIGELLRSNNIVDDLPPPPPPRRQSNLPSQITVDALAAQTDAFLVSEQLRAGTKQQEDAPQPPATPAAPASSTPPQAPQSIEQRQEFLKLKAMSVLANYLQGGDRIVRTEVLKNAQGQEIDRKITKIQRGCPSWAIAQIQKVTSLDS